MTNPNDELREALSADKRGALLTEFRKHKNWELSYCYEEDEEGWQVHKVVGSRNDREWRLIGQGDTPAEAIDAAIDAPVRGEGK